MTYKCMNNLAPQYLTQQFIKRSKIRSIRNFENMQISLYRTESGHRTFKYRAITLWNDVGTDLSLRQAVSVNINVILNFNRQV